MKEARRLSAQAPTFELESHDGRQWVCMFGTKYGVLEIDLNDGNKVKKSISDWLKENDLNAKLEIEGSMTEGLIEIGSVKITE